MATNQGCEREFNPVTLGVTEVLDFLQAKSDRLALSTIKGYITAITHRHELLEQEGKLERFSHIHAVRAWLRGLAQTKQVHRSLVPTWDLEIVLAGLKQAPFHPLDKISLQYLTLKTAFLVAVTLARRTS